MNNNVLLKGVEVLSTVFPDKKFNAKVMHIFLSDLSDDEFMISIQRIVSETVEIYPGTNFIALIRQKARQVDLISAGEAWGLVLKEIGRTGSTGIPNLPDMVKDAAECIGWRNICQSQNISVERAHFFKVYDSIKDRKNQEVVKIEQKTHLIEKENKNAV